MDEGSGFGCEIVKIANVGAVWRRPSRPLPLTRDAGISPQPLPPTLVVQLNRMSKNESKPSREQQHGGWSEVKRRFDRILRRTNGITKRQAGDLMKKYGEKDYETLVREARWLRC